MSYIRIILQEETFKAASYVIQGMHIIILEFSLLTSKAGWYAVCGPKQVRPTLIQLQDAEVYTSNTLRGQRTLKGIVKDPQRESTNCGFRAVAVTISYVQNSYIPQTEQHEHKGQRLFCLGNASYLLDVTPSNLQPNPIITYDFTLCYSSSKIWLLSHANTWQWGKLCSKLRSSARF